MAGCTTSQITINPAQGPSLPGIPGFGIPTSPFQIPIPGLDLPTELIEDLATLMAQLQAIFPSSIFKASLDDNMRTPLDFIASILAQIAPFLSFYNFIMAALNLIKCIIEVLCAIPNPFAMIAKLKKLFLECLPPFIALFPFMALIAMILALLLLIIALVKYILTTILAVIAQIIQNLLVFEKAIQLQDSESSLAAIQKITSLLCFIQNLMAIFVGLATVMAIIQSLMSLAGGSVCGDDDPDGCCGPDICPRFIKENGNGILTESGVLTYHHGINTDIDTILGGSFSAAFNIPALRAERWQVYDAATDQTYSISSIITPIAGASLPVNGQIFFPEASFNKDTAPTMAPYTVDLRMLIDPFVFHPTDVLRTRQMRIKGCVVISKPYLGVLDYKNDISDINSTGTLSIAGGKVFEDDGITPFLVSGTQATLNTFIHQSDTLGVLLPIVDDGYTVSNIEMTWFPNHPILANYNLITIGCIPEVSIEKAVQNAVIHAEGIAPKISVLPDVLGVQECVQNALNTFRTNVNKDSAAEFQASAELCLNNLLNQTTSIYCEAFIAGVSQFKSTVTLDTDAQFTTRPINITVVLKDAAGTNISTGVPQGCLASILDSLKTQTTFGEISNFVYDGIGQFNAKITSKESGAGTLKVLFQNKIFSLVVKGAGSEPSSIVENTVAYTFIDAVTQPQVRRDESDIAEND